MRVLVTGAAGFAGRHLCRLLLADGHELWGGCLPGEEGRFAGELAAVRPLPGDLCRPGEAAAAVARAAPERVYHLAGYAHVGRSAREPGRALEVNLGGTLRLLEALVEQAPRARLLHVSSSEVYAAGGEGPLAEDAPLDPATPYAIGKLAAEQLVRFFARQRGLEAVIVRPFNHTGPGQAPGFVAVDFARQVAGLAAGRGPAAITVGDLEARRDFSDVRDVAGAYREALERGRPGTVYNVGSGELRRVGDLLAGLLAAAGARAEVLADPGRLRRVDPPGRPADCRRLGADTGWRPAVPWAKTLADLLAWWAPGGGGEREWPAAAPAAGGSQGKG